MREAVSVWGGVGGGPPQGVARAANIEGWRAVYINISIYLPSHQAINSLTRPGFGKEKKQNTRLRFRHEMFEEGPTSLSSQEARVCGGEAGRKLIRNANLPVGLWNPSPREGNVEVCVYPLGPNSNLHAQMLSRSTCTLVATPCEPPRLYPSSGHCHV